MSLVQKIFRKLSKYDPDKEYKENIEKIKEQVEDIDKSFFELLEPELEKTCSERNI